MLPLLQTDVHIYDNAQVVWSSLFVNTEKHFKSVDILHKNQFSVCYCATESNDLRPGETYKTTILCLETTALVVFLAKPQTSYYLKLLTVTVNNPQFKINCRINGKNFCQTYSTAITYHNLCACFSRGMSQVGSNSIIYGLYGSTGKWTKCRLWRMRNKL